MRGNCLLQANAGTITVIAQANFVVFHVFTGNKPGANEAACKKVTQFRRLAGAIHVEITVGVEACVDAAAQYDREVIAKAVGIAGAKAGGKSDPALLAGFVIDIHFHAPKRCVNSLVGAAIVHIGAGRDRDIGVEGEGTARVDGVNEGAYALRLVFVRGLGHEKIEMVLGAIVLFQLEKRLGKLGTNQCQARIIGQRHAIVLGRPGEVAACLEDKAFDEKLPVGAELPGQGVAHQKHLCQIMLARPSQFNEQFYPC